MIPKKCARCKDTYTPTSNRQLLCKKCKKESKHHDVAPIPKLLSRSSESAINTIGISGVPTDYALDSEFPDIQAEAEDIKPDKIIKLPKKITESPRVEISIQGENITITTYKR